MAMAPGGVEGLNFDTHWPQTREITHVVMQIRILIRAMSINSAGPRRHHTSCLQGPSQGSGPTIKTTPGDRS